MTKQPLPDGAVVNGPYVRYRVAGRWIQGTVEHYDFVGFDELRRIRNEAMIAHVSELATELGTTLDKCHWSFDPATCYCDCPNGHCEHDWTGPEWTSKDGCASSVTCVRCGTTAMSHDLRTMP